jgi:hypothetical protein
VLQQSSESGLLEDAALPYALTNPVFMDVDGDGKFDPLFAEKIRPIAEPGKSAKKTSRN